MRSLWGIAPVSPLHFGYDRLVVEQKRHCSMSEHIVFLSDVHAMLSHGLSLDDVKRKSYYYEAVFSSCFGLDCKYIRGSDFELTTDYQSLLLSLCSHIRLSHSKNSISYAAKAGIGRKSNNSITVADILYPIMQCLDAAYLSIDEVFADESQRKIYELIDEQLASNSEALSALVRDVAWRQDQALCFPHSYYYVPLACDIKGKEFRYSSSSTRISIHETESSLHSKITQMYAPPAGQRILEGRKNALLAYLEFSVFPWINEPLVIKTDGGRVLAFNTFEELEAEYERGEIHPNDLKKALYDVLLTRIVKYEKALANETTSWVDRLHIRGRQC